MAKSKVAENKYKHTHTQAQDLKEKSLPFLDPKPHIIKKIHNGNVLADILCQIQ